MESTGSVNVSGGKLVRVSATYEEVIESVTITGDFFLEPPAARRDLEAAIEGAPVTVARADLVEAIQAVDATLIGFDAGDLADATLEAVR
ncbi:MAG: hypothetical protein ABEJ08_00720 [Halobacteriaceae archaeon]